jgi:anhydro-N-acetylmuramic acid kinase
MRVLGFMTGTSLDAVDMAVIETDGRAILGFGPAGERKLSEQTRALALLATEAALAWPFGAPEPAIFDRAREAVADEHLAAAESFLGEAGLTSADLDLVGVHGQTVLHQPRASGRPVGRTVQLIDADRLARGLNLPVAHDFRTADVAAGGQGAPLTPAYHRALAEWSKLDRPVAVLNLGGVANLTLIGEDGDIEAFDTGPANGMIDLWVQARTDRRYDANGALARAGRIDQAVVDAYLGHIYFAARGPRSVDRFDFPLDPVAGLSLEDGAATLTAFAGRAAAIGLAAASRRPRRMIVCGGGRHNPALMAAIAEHAAVPVVAAEQVGWRGDAIEAEAFAYLAARTAEGLPISFPATTGVGAPMTGGRIARA